MSFAIGQRWISETENSLGLGMITALDFRSVTLHFPATDETRIYAVAQAPLTRIVLNKGEQLHHHAGRQLRGVSERLVVYFRQLHNKVE